MEKKSVKIAGFIFCLSLMIAFSCSTTKKIPGQSDQIIGKWSVESITSGFTEEKETFPDEEMSIEFRKDNTAIIISPDEEPETFRYEVRDGNIYDLDKNEDPPMHIVSLDHDNMVLAIDIQIDYIELNLKRVKK